jgi:Tfp pilus assembly protein PilO
MMGWRSLLRLIIVLLVFLVLALGIVWQFAFPSVVEPPHEQARSQSRMPGLRGTL